ncbi:MAG TPA: Wzz/FepE/Etk N-terminal domain-containing protein [Acidobacteriaceae bacterium]|nr:Wzz/FepE/Etk N-terminal domain-containing protein [Acidobacteriaceae bacterium]
MQSALIVQSAPQSVALHEVASVIFRRKRLLLIIFFGTIAAALLLAFLLPSQYQSTAKLLVQKARADAVISPERTVSYQAPSEEVSEADLDSELELLKTHDILRKVVRENGLAGAHPSNAEVDRAVEKLSNKLKIDPIKKSNVIGLSYKSDDPQVSANVLNSLIALYLEKHQQIRQAGRDYKFFEQQAAIYKKQLEDIEKQIADAKFVAPQLMRDQMVGKRADLKASATATEAEIAETKKRIASLKELEQSTPQRLVTEKRVSDNPQLLQNLKGTLLTLQLQRDQLTAKYQPTYRPVVDLDKRIADTKAAIAREESQPLHEETTNQNTAYEWIRTEMAKAQAQLQGLLGRHEADAALLAADGQNLHNLNAESVQEQDLLRKAKTAETNYLLYSQKREEARISDELDANKILNVAVVQKAFVPATHVHLRSKIMLGGLGAALFLSLMAALLTDFFDPKFRSTDEVAGYLNVPVLASIPGPNELPRLEAPVCKEGAEGATA